MQALAETEFFAERGGVRFRGKESIGSALNDELSIIDGWRGQL